MLIFAAGKLLLNIPITWLETVMIVGFAVLVDHLFIYIRIRRLDFFSYASVNTALGVAFLLRTVDLEIYFLAVFLAIAQKHLLRINGRHFLNPSNVAVVAGLLFFPYATYTTPDQWGALWWLGAIMTLLGLFITIRVGRGWIPLVFSATYVLLTYAFITHNLTEIFYTLLSGSFLLFIYFMLTDPRTTPEQTGFQVIYAATIACLTILMELFFGAYDVTMFLALFIVSMFVPLIRMAQEKRSHIWRHAFGAITTVVLLIYLSPLNGMGRIDSVSPAHTAARLEAGQGQHQDIAIAWDTRPQWYQTEWGEPHLVVSAFAPQPRGNGFAPVDGGLSGMTPVVYRYNFGHDFVLHSPIAAGDINHDGYLDLVIATLGRPLGILINRGDGTFFDAAAELFDGAVPLQVEQVALADMDSDSYLDLIVSLNPYMTNGEAPSRWYRLNPQSRHYELKSYFPHPQRATVGSYAIYDINHDRIPDLYISMEHDWHDSDHPANNFMFSEGAENHFWVSRGSGWEERKLEYFPSPIERHAGMTAMFTDLDDDGKEEFLLGNDLQPDLTYRMGGDGIFHLMPKEQIQYNASSSMSYFGIDADNDGRLEIWENCISRDALVQRTRYGEYIKLSEISYGGDLFAGIKSRAAMAEEDCGSKATVPMQNICEEKKALRLARREGNRALCDNIENLERRFVCQYELDIQKYTPAFPGQNKRDAELFPRKVDKNILLKRKADGVYEDVLGDDGAALTGWSWAAYPYDLDNNGFQDLAITTGMALFSSDGPMALLMNYSKQGEPRLVNESRRYAVDFEEEGRGVMAADFDGDGDGELIINNLYAPPTHLDNRFGGPAIKVELRSKRGNYFALGSRITLYTNRGKQVREITIGGVWDSARPAVAHFGLADGEEVEKMTIRWPYGEETVVNSVEPNHHYIVYD